MVLITVKHPRTTPPRPPQCFFCTIDVFEIHEFGIADPVHYLVEHEPGCPNR